MNGLTVMILRRIRSVLLATALGGFYMPMGQAAPQMITIYEYHSFPPMVVSQEKRQGLSYSFARLLTDRSQGQFKFDVSIRTLPEVIRLLESEQAGVVLFVNPLWFGDVEETRYFWSKPVFTMRDEVVSRRRSPLEYNGGESFVGKTVLGISGYTYPDLDGLVQQGRATRINAKSDVQNLKRLVQDQMVDAAIVNSGPLNFYATLYGMTDDIYLSKKPQGEYQVKILMTRNLPKVNEYVNRLVQELGHNRNWLDMKRLYLGEE